MSGTTIRTIYLTLTTELRILKYPNDYVVIEMCESLSHERGFKICIEYSAPKESVKERLRRIQEFIDHG